MFKTAGSRVRLESILILFKSESFFETHAVTETSEFSIIEVFSKLKSATSSSSGRGNAEARYEANI